MAERREDLSDHDLLIRVDAQLATLNEQIKMLPGQMKAELQQHEEKCEIASLCRDVWGNAKPGLKADVASLQGKVASLESGNQKSASWWGRILQQLIIAAAVALAAWLAAIHAKGTP